MRKAVILLSVLLALACKRSGNQNADMNTNTIMSDATTAPAERRVELNEYEIRMPDTLPAGHASFLVVNSGKENHSFVIEGNGMRASLPEPLTRGNTKPLEVELQKGTYTVYCPVKGHRERGMSRTITVQ